jgi:hypothetical protein
MSDGRRLKKQHRGDGRRDVMSEEAKPSQDLGPMAELERVRDIIFGSQMRVYEQQFKRMTGKLELLGKQLEDMQADIEKQQADHEAATHKLQEETNQRQTELERNLSKQMGQLEQSFQEQAVQLRYEITSRLNQQDENLASQTRELASNLRKQSGELRNEFMSAVESLEGDKTSRHDLGDLLMEMGTRIKDQVGLADLLGQVEALAEDEPAD